MRMVDIGIVDNGDACTTGSVKSIVESGAEETSMVDSGIVDKGETPMVIVESRAPRAAIKSPNPCVMGSIPRAAHVVDNASAPAS